MEENLERMKKQVRHGQFILNTMIQSQRVAFSNGIRGKNKGSGDGKGGGCESGAI